MPSSELIGGMIFSAVRVGSPDHFALLFIKLETCSIQYDSTDQVLSA
jgi:hypothetical protein